MQQRYRESTFSYGNFRNQSPDSLIQGWETYDARPRFGTNWMGLRGRLAVLSEGYSNADFRTRVSVTYHFVHEVLKLAAEQTAAIKAAIRDSDRLRPDSILVRSTLAPPMSQDVVAEITEEDGAGTGGYARRRRTGVYRTIRMPVFDRFTGARKEAVPACYLLPARLSEIVQLLRRHGVAVELVTAPFRASVQTFVVERLSVDSLFEGHRPVTTEGNWRPALTDSSITAGWYLVRTDQPLGRLAGYLLEPASEDGVVTWNFLDRELQPGAAYPILRVIRVPTAPSVLVP